MKFFRIITAQVTTRSKLRLPSKFVERYGENLPGFVSLQVPTGAKWRVEVKKKKDGVWFGKGWFIFAESLGVKYGHFLMFDYDVMHAVFHVVAIDMSAVEIEYPALSSTDAEVLGSACYPKCPKVEKEADVEDDVILMTEDDSILGGNRSNGAQAPCCTCKDPRKTAKSIQSKNDDKNMSGVSPIGSEIETVKTDLTTMKIGSLGTEIILNSKGRIQCVVQGRKFKQTRSEKVLAKAKASKAEEPVCIIVLQPSYVSQKSNTGPKKKCQLLFPLRFIKAYFNLNINDATLMTSDGKTWSVKYRLRGQLCHLTYGWRQFSVYNYLRTGDVCLFELIRGTENALKIDIFRSTDDDEPPK